MSPDVAIHDVSSHLAQTVKNDNETYLPIDPQKYETKKIFFPLTGERVEAVCDDWFCI
jgi:hypothetical protein